VKRREGGREGDGEEGEGEKEREREENEKEKDKEGTKSVPSLSWTACLNSITRASGSSLMAIVLPVSVFKNVWTV